MVRNSLMGAGMALALCSAGAALAEEKPSVEAIPVRRTVVPDPAIRSGTLPNGMRYFIMQAASPTKGLSLRLGIDAGSFEESDSERGYAHLIEHMAFRATRSAPEGGLDRRFAPLGVAFGRDQNAATSVFTTTYKLDFATADEQGIDQGFGWLRDVADGVIFPNTAVMSERGVVLAEKQSRESPEALVGEAVERFQTPGLRSIDRNPLGTSEALTAATPDTLRAFYERWYRPENAVLVVVGDQQADMLEARIKTGFSSWRGKSDRPVQPSYGTIAHDRALDTFSAAAPSLPNLISACRVQPPLPRGISEIDRTMKDVRDGIWRGIINQRFQSLVSAGNSGLVGAGMMSSDERDHSEICLVAVPSAGKWENALAVAQAELRRFAKDGPTEHELETQIEAGRAVLRGAISVADGRTAPARADAILDRALDARPTPSPREAMHAYDVAVEDLDPASVKAAFATAWSGPGPLVALVMPKQIDVAAVRTAWVKGEGGAALAAFSDRKTLPWDYTAFGTPSAVAGREEIKDPGFTRLRFANGVILNFKQSTLEKNSVEVRAQFGAGRREIPNQDLIAAQLASGLLPAGGLGRLTATDMSASLAGEAWAFKLQIGNEAFDLTSSTTNASLEIELQVLAAFMTDPGFRPTLDERLPDAVEIMSRMYSSNPAAALSEAFLGAVDPEDPDRMPPRATMDAWRSADFARLLKPALTTAPVELTIVGDVSEATATRLVASTFGALALRPPRNGARADARFLRVPDRSFPVIRKTYQGPADRAAAQLIWPLYVANASRRAEEYALKLTAAIFDMQLRQRIRTELGKSYSPQVVTQTPDDADQGILVAQIESNPADVEQLVAEAQAVARKIASGGITAEELEAARRPILAAVAALRGRNIWWAAAMDGSARNPGITEEAIGMVPLMSSITLDQVKAAAAKWLARPPIVTIVTPNSGPSAPGGTVPVTGMHKGGGQ
ncbi:MAG: insulinase family protein [Sphingomonas bacterium]